MAYVNNPVFEADVFEDAVFTGVSTDVIDQMIISDKRIYLKDGTRAYHPIDDIYREMRFIRGNDESLRVLDVPVETSGNIFKGTDAQGKDHYTARLAIFKDGWEVVPASTEPTDKKYTLQVLGEQISDIGTSGAALIDMDLVAVDASISVEYAPPDTEVIVIGGTSAPTAQENADAVWSDQRALDISNELHYIERAVHIDPEALTQGIGTQSNPFNTVEAALDFAEINNLKLLHILSDVTVDRNLKNFVIIGIGTPTIDCNGHNLDRSEFFHCRMKGNYIGKVLVQQSILLNNFQLNGIFEKCPIEGVVDMVGDSLIVGCYSYVGGLGYPVLKISAGNAVFRDYHGSIGVADCTSGTHSIGVASGGRVVIESTSIGGNIHVRGFPFDIVDTSGVSCNVFDETASSKVRELHEASFNRRRHDDIENTITIYESDNTTPKQIFDTTPDLSDITPR